MSAARIHFGSFYALIDYIHLLNKLSGKLLIPCPPVSMMGLPLEQYFPSLAFAKLLSACDWEHGLSD